MKLTSSVIVILGSILFTAMLMLPRTAFANEEFLIGIIPEENIFKTIKKHRPLEQYLSNEMGIKVKFTILSRYGDIVERFNARYMDGAFFGIYTSVLARENLDVEPIVRSVNLDGSTTAKGLLITRQDSGIRSLTDMRNKRAVFVDKATATGYVFAIAYLRENGVSDTENFFSEYEFTGSHESVIFAVLDGRADIGVAKERVLNRLVNKDPIVSEELRIIAKSPDLPDNTLMIKKDIDPEIKQKLKETLLKLDRSPEGIAILESIGIKKFIDATDEDFSEVKELMTKAGTKIEG